MSLASPRRLRDARHVPADLTSITARLQDRQKLAYLAQMARLLSNMDGS